MYCITKPGRLQEGRRDRAAGYGLFLRHRQFLGRKLYCRRQPYYRRHFSGSSLFSLLIFLQLPPVLPAAEHLTAGAKAVVVNAASAGTSLAATDIAAVNAVAVKPVAEGAANFFPAAGGYHKFVGGCLRSPLFSTRVDWSSIFDIEMENERLSGWGLEPAFIFGLRDDKGLYFDGVYGLGWSKVSGENAVSLSAVISTGFVLAGNETFSIIPAFALGVFSFFLDDSRTISRKEMPVYLSEINLVAGPEIIFELFCTGKGGFRVYLPFLFGIGKSQCSYYPASASSQIDHWGTDRIFLFTPGAGIFWNL